MRERVTELIEQGLRDGELRPELDPVREAVTLFAMIDGLGGELLLGVRDPADALATIRYHLDRLFCRVNDDTIMIAACRYRCEK
ncbi:TetR family transcriptional regulator C-terminal domain-containing protein [Microtetraspora malaysiensis]|uniref:TetR family transcriptional regulator C-terminal domain-containing protein n=1 Tax=Microtetraspora malaysiensis TaxID=161358 RepID=UPI003D9031A0